MALALPLLASDWPQWRGPNRDNSWPESGILQTFPAEGLKVRWRRPVGFGYGSPVVAKGRVHFADSNLARPQSHERVFCLDEATGRTNWTYAYDFAAPDWAFTPGQEMGPNATPIIDAGQLYTLGWLGDLYCFDAATGDVRWKKNLAKEYPEAELRTTGSPLVEGNLLILVIGGKPDACVVALDKHTGKEVWRALADTAGYSSPILVSVGGVRQLIVWTMASVTSLNPATGATYWRELTSTPADTVISTPVASGLRLLVGGIMLQLDADKPAAKLLWPANPKPTERYLSATSTALPLGDHIYSALVSGEFACLEAATGRRVWTTNQVTDLKSGATVHVTPNGGSVLLFNDRGELIRARLGPEGYREISRVKVIEPMTQFGGRKVIWNAPAFANGHIFVRSSRELLRASLLEEP
jgi:outer membrane protein assembly factor BamB